MASNRRAFIGAAGIGAVAAAVSSAEPSQYGGDYSVIMRPPAGIGLGRNDAVCLSIVWMPGKGRQQLTPLKARLVLYDLDGKRLVQKEATVAPFTGASIDYQPPANTRRQQIFGYVFIDGLTTRLGEELFGGIEVYDVSSGRTNNAAAPIGVG